MPKSHLFTFVGLLLHCVNSLNFGAVSKWSNIALAEQDTKRQQILANFSAVESKWDNKESYYKLISQPVQNACHVYKKLAGRWSSGCGFIDGEKLVCMDGIYQAIQKGNCLIYSFGLADDWDFEILMAKLGCTVRAYDPSTKAVRPKDAFHPLLHYYNMGIGQVNGKAYLTLSNGEEEIIPMRTLEHLLKENGDFDKEITYLKMDVEGTEIWSHPNWLKTKVLRKVQQLGIEMHTCNSIIDKSKIKVWFPKLVSFMQALLVKYGLVLAAYNPNLCQEKSHDAQRTFYSYHDALFVKKTPINYSH